MKSVLDQVRGNLASKKELLKAFQKDVDNATAKRDTTLREIKEHEAAIEILEKVDVA